MASNHHGNHRQSVADLTRGLVADAEDLFRLEVALAKQEVKETAKRDAFAIGMLAGGTLLVVLGLLVALPLMIVLASGGGWKAALIWVVAYLVVGAGLGIAGRMTLRLEVAPAKTIASLKETREWIKGQINSLSG